VKILKGHTQNILSLVYSPDGQVLASAAGKAHTIWLWDVPSAKPVAQLSGHRSRLLGLAMSPTDSLLASIDLHGQVKLWNWAEHREITEFHVTELSNHDLCFSPDGKLLAAPHAYGITLWNVAAEKIETQLKNVDYEIAALEFTPDGQTLAILRDRKALMWDVQSRKYGKPVDLKAIGFDLAFSPDGRWLAIAGGWSIFLFDAATREQVAVLRGHKGIVWSVRFSPDSKILASGSNDGTVRFWWPHGAKEQAVVDWKIGKIYVVTFPRTGRTIAAGGETGDIVVWDVK